MTRTEESFNREKSLVPPFKSRKIGVAVDLAGCPNRCRHCSLGSGPNEKLPTEVLGEVADAFWSWKKGGEEKSYFEEVDVSSWYREPDYRDDYRELYELQRELSRREPRRYELLSIWRLARDPDYARWAKGIGPRRCQITFFGMEEVNDYFHRRRGAFRDNVKATERLLEVGMIPRWQIFLTKPGLADLEKLMDLVSEMRLRGRVADMGAEFDVFCHDPGPGGEAFLLEDIRIEESDLCLVPKELMESSERHFEGQIGWETEGALVDKILNGMSVAVWEPDELWFFVNSELDVFPNYDELSGGWRLGNFRKDGLDSIIEAFQKELPRALWAHFNVRVSELAERFGRRGSRRLYRLPDLKSRWVHMYGAAQEQSQ